MNGSLQHRPCRQSSPVRNLLGVLLLALPLNPLVAQEATSPPTLTDVDETGRQQIEQFNSDARRDAEQRLQANPEPPAGQPGTVDLWSTRGDAHMFLGNFAAAETSYRQMIQLDPTLDPSHWRLGIACFFADHAKAGADQFEKYHSFDSVDRENGIWRYFCHHRAAGRDAAKQQLLRYEKDDRPPFREVYQMFQGQLTPAAVLAAAEAGGENSRPQRQFYSWLYVGLNAALEGDRKLAEAALSKAVLNDWGRRAGYGPNYMWHVGRLELNRLRQPEKPNKPK